MAKGKIEKTDFSEHVERCSAKHSKGVAWCRGFGGPGLEKVNVGKL